MIRWLIRATKQVFSRPSEFFSGISKSRGIRKPFLFLVALTLITMLFLTYYYIDAFNSYLKTAYSILDIQSSFQLKFTADIYIIVYISLGLLFIIAFFLRSWLTHLWVRAFKGKHNYDKTYSSMSYASAPDYIAAPAFVAMFFLFTLASESGSLIYWGLLIICALIFAALAFYQMYIKTMALSRLQNISRTRAFLSIYVFGVISYFIAAILIEILLLTVLFLIYLAFFA